MVKINKILRFYDEPLLKLVHYKYLELKLIDKIYLVNGGKSEGLKYIFY